MVKFGALFNHKYWCLKKSWDFEWKNYLGFDLGLDFTGSSDVHVVQPFTRENETSWKIRNETKMIVQFFLYRDWEGLRLCKSRSLVGDQGEYRLSYSYCWSSFLHVSFSAVTVRTWREITDWFSIGREVMQGCILSPQLFNIHAEDIMQEALRGLERGIPIAGKRLLNFRYVDEQPSYVNKEELLNIMNCWSK